MQLSDTLGWRARRRYMSLFKELYAKDELPYDKFMRLGPECLSDAELLAIMLRTGTRERTPIELGRDVLKLAGEGMGFWGCIILELGI